MEVTVFKTQCQAEREARDLAIYNGTQYRDNLRDTPPG